MRAQPETACNAYVTDTSTAYSCRRASRPLTHHLPEIFFVLVEHVMTQHDVKTHQFCRLSKYPAVFTPHDLLSRARHSRQPTLLHRFQHGLLLPFHLQLRCRLLHLCCQVRQLRLLDVHLRLVRVRLHPRVRVVQALNMFPSSTRLGRRRTCDARDASSTITCAPHVRRELDPNSRVSRETRERPWRDVLEPGRYHARKVLEGFVERTKTLDFTKTRRRSACTLPCL